MESYSNKDSYDINIEQNCKPLERIESFALDRRRWNTQTRRLIRSKTSNKRNDNIIHTFLPNSISKEIQLENHKLIMGATISDDGRYYICGGSHALSVFDLDNGDFALHKRVKLKSIEHHITSLDYNDQIQKVLVTTLNEKIQLHSIYPEVKKHTTIKVQEKESVLFLFEYENRCGIFDAKFSEKDGSQFIVSMNNGLAICDVERQCVIAKVENIHWEDINTLDIKVKGASDNLIVTGGDDAIINVLDKRLLGDESHQTVGRFFGHNSGITSIDLTDNCTYIASNGKDQCVKLWDIRKMNPPSFYSTIIRKSVDYDYRNTKWDKSKEFVHEADNSIFTFRGHNTHFTLIRCKFSPQSWTNQRYIACGSFCGCTVIYDTYTGEKLGSLISNNKLISKVPIWHPKERKLICSYEDAIKVFEIYEYDLSQSAFKQCIGKINLSSNLSNRYTKHQMEVEESYKHSQDKNPKDY